MRTSWAARGSAFKVNGKTNAWMRFGLIGLLVVLLSQTGLFSFAKAAEDGLMMLSVASESTKTELKRVQAKVLIEAPPRMVWKTLTNYPRLKNILPGYEKSSVVRTKGSNIWVDIAMKVAVFLPTYRYQVQVSENEPDYRINMVRVSGDFKTLNATYQLVPQANGRRTLLVYNLNIDPGSFIPGSQGLIRSNTEKSLKALERHIEQEARKSVIGQG